MKTFLRKVKLSFLAMLRGWIACNIAWWLGAIPSMEFAALRHIDLSETVFVALAVAVFTALVIIQAWLVIFLPVDLCLRDESSWRRPKAAAALGFIAAAAIVAAVYGYLAWSGDVSSIMDRGVLPYVLGTCVTGTVAGYVRARLDKSKTPAAP